MFDHILKKIPIRLITTLCPMLLNFSMAHHNEFSVKN
jgi:hypothetical protein